MKSVKAKTLVFKDLEKVETIGQFAHLPLVGSEMMGGALPQIMQTTASMEMLKQYAKRVNLEGVELVDITISWDG